jgi:hypothetical protein
LGCRPSNRTSTRFTSKKETTMNTMHLKKIAGAATLAAALGAATFGLGMGSAQAQPKWNPRPVVPSDTDFTQPPGHIGQDLGIPPGQFKQIKKIKVVVNGETVKIRNPYYGVPPGHWGDIPLLVPTPTPH